MDKYITYDSYIHHDVMYISGKSTIIEIACGYYYCSYFSSTPYYYTHTHTHIYIMLYAICMLSYYYYAY